MDIFSKIQYLYRKQGYSQKYGMDIFITIILFITFLIIFIALFLHKNKKIIQADWESNQCNPKYMLFSGWIQKGADQTELEATVNNFDKCMSDILKTINKNTFGPIVNLTNIKIDNLNKIGETFKGLNKDLVNAKNVVSDKIKMINAGLSGLTGPGVSSEGSSSGSSGGSSGGSEADSGDSGGVIFIAQYVFADMFKKIAAIFPILSHILTTIMNTIQSFFVAAYSAFNGLLIILTPIIIMWTVLGVVLILVANILFAAVVTAWSAPAVLAAGIICIILALVFFVLFLIIAVAGLLYNEFLMLVFNVSEVGPKKSPKKPTKGLPKSKGCFDESTIIQTKEGYRFIHHLRPGELLKDGSRVTAVMKCVAPTKMYNIQNILVTADHPILDIETNSYIPVSQHQESVLVSDYQKPFVYCISTSSKIIHIYGFTFTDWDELDEMDRDELALQIPFRNHCFINGGLTKHTHLAVKIGDTIRNISISKLIPGMHLASGSKVMATIQTEPIEAYEYPAQHISGSDNLVFQTKDHVIQPGEELFKISMGTKTLYHIVTDNNKIQLPHCTLYDYDAIMDSRLENDRRHLFLNP